MLVVLVVGVSAWLWPRADGDVVRFADLEVGNDAGERVLLAEELGAVSLVHFWATWCGPCREEVPELLRLALEQPELDLLLVAVEDAPDAVAAFWADGQVRPVSLRVLYDDWTAARAFGTATLPESHLVVDGRVVDSFVGAMDWNDDAMRRRLDAAIARAVSGSVSESRQDQKW